MKLLDVIKQYLKKNNEVIDGRYARKTKVTEVEEKVTSLGEKVVANETGIAGLGDRATIVEGKVTDLEGKVETAETGITALEEKVATAEGDITTLKEQVATAGEDLTGLQEKIADLETADGVLEGKIDGAIADLQNANGEIGALQTELGEVKADVVEVKADVVGLEAGLNDLKDGVYTKEEVDGKIGQKVADLVDSAPETLDTLKELADALGNDANFSTTVTNMIAEKVSLGDNNVEDIKSTITEAEIEQEVADMWVLIP